METNIKRIRKWREKCCFWISLLFFTFSSSFTFGQKIAHDEETITLFVQQQKAVNLAFNHYFNSSQLALYGAKEAVFINKIDSLRNTFIIPLDSFKKAHPHIRSSFFEEEYTDLNYTFNKFILDYVPIHKRITGKTVMLSRATQARLQKIDINNPKSLKYEAFRKYLNSVLQQKMDEELLKKKAIYQKSSNKRLAAGMTVLPQLFKNELVQNQMRYELLAYHMDNYGVKGIESELAVFRKKNTNPQLLTKIDSAYHEGISDRKDHLVEVYKNIDGYTLDAHIFKPNDQKEKHPAIVFFHGGGWSEGKPDWFFYTCKAYAAKGWVAIAIEYRLRDRHGTLPPAAIEDGKSAIRYLRKHAERLQIDPIGIVASGNSAGANLALSLALIDTLDHPKEDWNISSVPNALMLNSVATDFTQGDFWQQYFTDKKFLERISPLHQVRKDKPPILLISGSRDNNVPVQATIDFANKMKSLGNDCELYVLEGAGHFIWYDRRFSPKVEAYRSSFLKRLGY